MTIARDRRRDLRRALAAPPEEVGPVDAVGKRRRRLILNAAFKHVTEEHPEWPRDTRREVARTLAKGTH